MTVRRPDIDGLRAIAIAAVVLFHTKLVTLPGGYLGVDVFFVISGFLITSLIAGEIETSRFSIVEFYERRARRLLPALFTVLFVASIAAHWLLFPDDFIRYVKSLAATMGFASNVFFSSQERGYFAQGFEPLLHTWSLAVEEQFYIAYPLFLILVNRYWRGSRFAVLAAVTL